MNSKDKVPMATSVASVAPPTGREIGGTSSFPVDALPPPVLDIVDSVADRLQVPDALPACCALATISAAIGSGLRVRTIGDRTLRGNIYVVVSVPSGSGKTETFNDVLKPVFERQHWLDEQAKRRWSVVEVDRIVLADEIKKLKTAIRHEHESGNDATELKKKLAASLEKQRVQIANPNRILCDDATGAALERFLSHSAVFSASDEAGTAILGNLMGRFGKGSDEAVYVRAFSGGYHGGVDRIGRESVRLDDPCLTILWLMQPHKLDELYAHQRFREDGLLARVLVCRIETRPRKVHSPRFAAGYFDAVREEWGELWLDLHQTYHQSANEPHILVPTKEATALMRDYQDETAERRQRDLADVDGLAARWVEQAWRLAVVLHAARHGKEAHLQKVRADDTIKPAIKFTRWFSEHQLALLATSRAAAAELRERKVIELLQSRLAKPTSKDWIKTGDLVMHRITPTSEEAKQLLRNMEAAGKLTSAVHRPAHGGHTELRYSRITK